MVSEPMGGPSFMMFQKVKDIVVVMATWVADAMAIALVVSYPALLDPPVARSKAVKPIDEAPFLRGHWVPRIVSWSAGGL